MIIKKLSPIFESIALPPVTLLTYDERAEHFIELTVPTAEATIIPGLCWSVATGNYYYYKHLSNRDVGAGVCRYAIDTYTRVAVYTKSRINEELVQNYLDFFDSIIKSQCTEIVEVEEDYFIVECDGIWFNSPLLALVLIKALQTSVLYDGEEPKLTLFSKYANFTPNEVNGSIEQVFEKIAAGDYGFSYFSYPTSYAFYKNCNLSYHGTMINVNGEITNKDKFYLTSEFKDPAEFSRSKGCLCNLAWLTSYSKPKPKGQPKKDSLGIYEQLKAKARVAAEAHPAPPQFEVPNPGYSYQMVTMDLGAADPIQPTTTTGASTQQATQRIRRGARLEVNPAEALWGTLGELRTDLNELYDDNPTEQAPEPGQ